MKLLEKETGQPTGDIVDMGSRGKEFEAAFVKGLKLLGLKFSANKASGALWDIHPEGSGWHRLLKDRDVNLKVSATRWLFSDGATYGAAVKAAKMVERGTLTPEQADKRVETALRKSLLKKGGASATFTKPRSSEIQSAIISAAKKGDLESLWDLLQAKNFASKRLGRVFSVNVGIAWDSEDWRDKGFIGIEGGLGSKKMKVTGRPRKISGAWTFAFRDRSATAIKPHHPAHSKEGKSSAQ